MLTKHLSANLPLTINTAPALVDLTKFVTEHTYTPDLDGCVSLNVRTLIMRRSLRVVVVICVEESSITSISVPLFTLSQVMSGLGIPSAVQENMAGSGDTTLTLMGGAVMEGEAETVRSILVCTLAHF